MRWGLIVMMLLLQVAGPMHSLPAQAEAVDARDGEAVLLGLDETVVHRNELIEVSFTLHNMGSIEETFLIDTIEVPEDLAVSGLPLTHTLDAGFLKTLKFNLSADATAAYGTLTLSISLGIAGNDTWSAQSNLTVIIAPYSRLDFGVQGVSSFVSDAGTRTSVAVNITNNGSYEDDVTFNFYTQSGWNWGWAMNESDGVNAFETLQPGQLSYVYVWVDVPEITDGSPLAGTGPRFQLKAVSGVDNAVSQWSFDLLMGSYQNASIDSKSEDLTLNPGANGRIEVDVRNVGNTANRLSITLQAIDTEGQPITGVPLDDRIARNGWTMALFSGLEGVSLEPNESRTIEIGIQAPGDYFGEINVRVRVFAEGASQRLRTIDVGAVIDWQRNATVELRTDECRSLLPNATCTASMFLENTGNARDTFTINLVDASEDVTATIMTASISLDSFESSLIDVVTITASAEALAFKTGNVSIEVQLSGTNTVVGEINIPTKIAPVILWVFEDIIEEVDARGRLSITMTARNEGNAVDGLLVQLQSSHSTQMSFIPPFAATYEEGIAYPRSFEITDIPIGYNFTIEAWVDLPQDQQSNGTVYVNTTVRSQLAPDLPFIQTTSASYLGLTWQPAEENEGWFDIAAIAGATVGIFSAWIWVIISVVISVFIVQKSLTARRERKTEQALLAQLHAPSPAEEPQDWMMKFSEKTEPAPQPAALAVSAEHFQQAFTNRAGSPTPSAAPVLKEVHASAAHALDVQDNQRTIALADDLLLDIASGNVAKPLTDSNVLPKVHVPANLTVRHDPKGFLGTQPETVEVPSVPLPNVPSALNLDDLDV